MDPLNSETLAGLRSAFQSLLPPPSSPALTPDLTVSPLRFTSTGLSGFVGVHHDPDGDIVGRRLRANAIVGVKTQTLAGLNDAVAGVTAAVVGATRADLRKLGILDVAVTGTGPKTPPSPGAGGIARQEVTFGVSYEHLKLPTAAEGVIQAIPLDVELSRARDPRRLIATELGAPDALDLFEVVDDPLADKDGPSSWSVDAAGGRIAQTSGIWGGTTAVNANKPGTYLVLRTTPGRPAVADFILRAEVQSDGDQGIGLVFRYQDSSNFYILLSNRNKGYRLLARKVAGSFQQLALDPAASFTVGAPTRLKVVAVGPDLRVFVDDEPALAGSDTALPGPGRVGFATFQNPQAFFYGIELVAI